VKRLAEHALHRARLQKVKIADQRDLDVWLFRLNQYAVNTNYENHIDMRLNEREREILVLELNQSAKTNAPANSVSH
jgi:hypothetical protein